MKVEDVRDVREVLAPFDLEPPNLEMLCPSGTYTCLLLQPSGPIYASSERIGGLDQELNGRKVLSFAKLANEKGAHLAVAPEYFTPWSELRALIEQDVVPPAGALWVLGCESIRQEELAQFKGDVAETCDVIYESYDTLRADRPLLDPAVLLFTTRRISDGSSRLVALVQFKTCPSRDKLFFEEGLLKCGKEVYRFRGHNSLLSAVAVICSDAFALDEYLVSELVDRSTLIHIQLNPDPRNSAYRQYRKTAFDLNSDLSKCHIVCLNWARTVTEHNGDGKVETWPAVGCSTWYCSKDSCAQTDDIVLPNHRLGLYYTYMTERRHALILYYDEAIFELRVPKVVTKDKAVLANKNGPNSVARYEWDNDKSAWVIQNEPCKADFDQLLGTNEDAAIALKHMDLNDVLNVERLLALSAGAIDWKDDWYSLGNIDSFCVESDETVRRITVAQDTNECAEEFRHDRLDVVAQIRHELDVNSAWPPQISGTDKDAKIGWDDEARLFNVYCSDGTPGLICYLGESPSNQVRENIPSMLIDLLRRAGGPHRNRLCVLYRRYGELKFAPLPGLTRIDDALMDERDISSANTDETMG